MHENKPPRNRALLSAFVVDLPKVLRQRDAKPLHFYRRKQKDILYINLIPPIYLLNVALLTFVFVSQTSEAGSL
jgi:hypothetical protein